MQTNNAKRFFETVGVAPSGDGHSITLDDRPVRTPEGSLVVVPTVPLAELVAGEWSSQEDDIKPLSMPVMRLVCTAIDKVIPVREQVVEQISDYGKNDLLCYRSEGPDDVIAHQATNWQPILDWLEATHGLSLNVTHGIVHVPQPETSIAGLKKLVGGYEDFRLTGLAELTQLTGSLVLAISFLEGHLDGSDILTASQLDDDWQADKWGEDSEATQRRKNLELDIFAAARFLSALG